MSTGIDEQELIPNNDTTSTIEPQSEMTEEQKEELQYQLEDEEFESLLNFEKV